MVLPIDSPPHAPPPPEPEVPSIASRWIRLVLGFGVSVAVGLAPYLGKLDIPLFTPLLSIIPDSLQPIAIPLSAAAMGIVAVFIQWHGTQGVPPDQLKSWFGRTLLLCIGGLLLLAAVETIAVVRVEVLAVDRTVSFAIGPSNPGTPPCTGLSRADCIKTKLSLDETRIDTYFGEQQVNITKFVLVLVYTTFMSTFGALVGLMMLAQDQKKKASAPAENPNRVDL